MTPEELLERHPREAVRWLRGRLGLMQMALSFEVGADAGQVGSWESGRAGVSPRYRGRLAALLAPHLATAEGEAFVRSLAESGETTSEEGRG